MFLWENSRLFCIFLPQQRTGRHSCQPAAAAGRVCGDSPAGRHPLAERARERGPADLGVHQAAAAGAHGGPLVKPVPYLSGRGATELLFKLLGLMK